MPSLPHAGPLPPISCPAWGSRCHRTPTPPPGVPGGPSIPAPPYDCLIGPPGLGEKALHRPGRDAHRFREILGVAPLLVLHQQRLKVIPAVIPPLLAAEGGRKEGVEFLKAVVDPLEARRIHHSNHPTSSVQPSYQTTRRCSTRRGETDIPHHVHQARDGQRRRGSHHTGSRERRAASTTTPAGISPSPR